MKIDLDELSARDRYKLLSAVVIPRPIAWVTTINRQGLVNVAPFSFFNLFGADPATVILGLEHHADGSQKDTTRNIEETGEYTINILTPDLNDVMVATAARYSADIGEATALGLELTPSTKVAPPRLTCAPVALECRKTMALSLSPERSIMIGEAITLSARDGLIDVERNYVNWKGNYPTARLFADKYARLVETEPQTIPARPPESTQ
jgi:flavin reductase (DIM6/NTAB) family NADH-FMN oxidoreductase RutF